MNEKEKKMLAIFKEEVKKEQSEYENANEYTKFIYNNRKFILDLAEKQQKEIDKMQKELDLDGEVEIALNNRIMDLEKEIDKQNKELNKLKSKNKELLRKLRNRVKENNKLIKYSNYKKEFSTLNKQIDKQNKVIDGMAETIIKERGYRNTDEHPEWIETTKRFFLKKVENDERRKEYLRKVEENE